MYSQQENIEVFKHRRLIKAKNRKINKFRTGLCLLSLLGICIVIVPAVNQVRINLSNWIDKGALFRMVNNWHSTGLNHATDGFRDDDTAILKLLNEMSQNDKRISEIIDNMDLYPKELLKLLVSNAETLDFVYNYPEKKDSDLEVVFTGAELDGHLPLFLQWDPRWGYAPYGNDIIALSGCGPTCLSMVAVGLTGNTGANPKEIARHSISSGYASDKGTDWRLFSVGAENYGIRAKELPLWESNIIEELNQGHPIICSMGPGKFTTTGHFIVIYGMEDGRLLIHDPNSIERSQQQWLFDDIKDEILNLWSFSKIEIVAGGE